MAKAKVKKKATRKKLVKKKSAIKKKAVVKKKIIKRPVIKKKIANKKIIKKKNSLKLYTLEKIYRSKLHKYVTLVMSVNPHTRMISINKYYTKFKLHRKATAVIIAGFNDEGFTKVSHMYFGYRVSDTSIKTTKLHDNLYICGGWMNNAKIRGLELTKENMFEVAKKTMHAFWRSNFNNYGWCNGSVSAITRLIQK